MIKNTGRHYILMILTWLFIGQIASANQRFESYQLEQGLSQNTVNCILQDSFGFLWVCTQGGLNRFDGYQFQVFGEDSNKIKGLSDDYVTSLYESKQKALWIGTRSGGLNRFDFASQTIDVYQHDPEKNSLSDNRVTAIIADSHHLLWLGTFAGINTFSTKTKQFSQINTKYNDNDLKVTSLLKDADNNIWVGTLTRGLIKFSGENYQHIEYFRYRDGRQLLDDNIWKIYQDSHKNIWVGTNRGANRLAEGREKFESFTFDAENEFSISSNIVRDFVEDSNNTIWIATAYGLNQLPLSSSKFNHFYHNPSDDKSIRGNSIANLYISEGNVLWLGLFSRGLNKYEIDSHKFTHFKHNPNNNNSLNANSVWAFAEKDADNIWIGTDGGGVNLLNLPTKNFSQLIHDPKNANSISGNRIWALLQYSPDELWVGTFNNGLNKVNLKNGKVTRYRNDSDNEFSLSSDKVIALFKDHKNQVWIGTNNGLNLLVRKKDQFIRFKHIPGNKNSLTANFIMDITEDSQHNLWISTYDKGVNKYNPTTKNFIHYQYLSKEPLSKNSLSNDKAMHSFVSSNGHIWVATQGGGISVINPENGVIKRHDEQEGLADDATYAVLEDNNGNFWISSNSGISKYEPNNNKYTNFPLSAGLQSTEYNSGAYLKSSTGKIIFGGINGFNVFDPNEISQNDTSLNVTITSLRVFNKPVNIKKPNSINHNKQYEYQLDKALYMSDSLELTHKESLVSFEFSTLNFSYSNEVIYQYKLDGFDNDWLPTNNNSRLATYTNLPAGKYTLLVRARLNQGTWQDNVTALSVIILPPPWLTWWAILGYMVVIFVIAYAFIRQRNRRFVDLEKSEERLLFALWGSQSMLWDWDVVNKVIIRSTGKHQNSGRQNKSVPFILSDLQKLIHPDDYTHVKNTYTEHINDKTKHLEVNYRLKNKEGDWRWYRARASAALRSSSGKALRIVGTVEDINQLIEAKLQLQQLNDELEKRVKDRTRELSDTLETLKSTQSQLIESKKMASLIGLVNGVAHALNTPLGIAKTSISLLETEIYTLFSQIKDQKLSRQHLSSIEKNYHQAILLLNKNLDKSIRLVKNFKSLSLHNTLESSQDFYIEKHVKQVIGAIYMEGIERFAEINIEIIAKEETKIHSYKSPIVEVLKHLIENSYIHAFTNIEHPKVVIEILKNNQEICIIYSDNGIGITDNNYEKIFEPFYTTKRGSGCTGLGMPIIYNQIIHKLNGSISWDEEYKQGMKIFIHFPIKNTKENV
ncbi:MAG: ATP-binding protein [Colwellia sp.]|nr:ATP-binding protein [Colwellia sp.]